MLYSPRGCKELDMTARLIEQARNFSGYMASFCFLLAFLPSGLIAHNEVQTKSNSNQYKISTQFFTKRNPTS